MVTPRSTATWPSSGVSSPVIIRNNVVLPDPLGPTRPTFSPFWIAAEASMKRSWWPFCLLTLSRRIMCTRGRGNVAVHLGHLARARKGNSKRGATRPLPLSRAGRCSLFRHHREIRLRFLDGAPERRALHQAVEISGGRLVAGAQRHQQVGIEQRGRGGAVGHGEDIAYRPGLRAHAGDVPLDHVARG